MCPLAMSPPLAEIDPCWTDEQLILLLDKCKPESSLPSNVLSDISPYQHPPANLPGEIWYLVRSTEKKESVSGFWKPKGEPCKVYSDSAMTGWRITLEYFEGHAPNEQRTEWLMQEYSITRKESCGDEKAKELRLLCRVFICSGHGSDNMIPPYKCETDIDSLIAALPELVSPNISVTSTQRSIESKLEAARVLSEAVDEKTSFSPQDIAELDCILTGDYLELKDLEDPESQSSSSQISSCPSKLSEDRFDTLAAREMEREENEYRQQRKQSSSKYSFTPSVTSNDVVLQPAPSVSSLLHDARRIEPSKGSQISSTIGGSLADDRVHEHTTKRRHSDSRTNGTETTSTTHKNAGPRGKKKASSGRMKKLKMYLCFMTI